MYVVLQYLSTVVGMVALVAWIALWYRKTTPAAEIEPLQRKSFYAWLGVGMLAGAAACGLVRAMLLTGVPRNINSADRFLASFSATFLAVAFWELLVYSLVATARQTQPNATSHRRT